MITAVIAALFAITAEAQLLVSPNRPYRMLNPRPGYLTINEFTTGFGLAGTETPYSDFYYGFTSVHSYQIDRRFAIGGGTGLSVYGDGMLIPLFFDMRFRFRVSTLSFYGYGNGGLLIDPGDIDGGTKYYINAGPGVRLALSNSFAVKFGPGLFTQMGPTSRASFVMVRLGFSYKPN